MFGLLNIALYFLTALALSLLLTPLWKYLAHRCCLLDWPDSYRKIHKKPIPLGGGWVIFIVFFLVLFFAREGLLSGDLSYGHWLGFLIGGLIIMIGGTLDDRFKLKPWQQIIFPLGAVLAILIGGVEISHLGNPWGETFSLGGLPWLSYLLIFVWLMGVMYTTKLLDGVDGLVSGLGAFGALIIFLFTSLTTYYQPDIALAALILAGACFGFLFFNFHPASVFLGEGGSLLIGYFLGVLSIISGSKIAIALLIIGLPALDVAWTIIRRWRAGQNPFKFADRRHLHHRLLDFGLNQKQTAGLYYGLALFFGGAGLFLQSRGKILALFLLFILMLFLVIYLSLKSSRKKRKSLLLHVCCAPCATYWSRQYLKRKFELAWYFCNPNLESLEEFNRRLIPVKEAAKELDIELFIDDYSPEDWEKMVSGRESDPEKGERCRLCYSQRLSQTVNLAELKAFDFFSSSLLISPHKDQKTISQIAAEKSRGFSVRFFKFNFNPDDYSNSIKLAKKKHWYRQNFCGCRFSRRK